MNPTTQAFRQRYRAGVHPRYNPWLHGGFVLAFGLLAIVFFANTLEQVSVLQWLALPATLLLFNLGIYLVHRYLGHHKRGWARLFYARHTGDHHSFFSPGHMTYDSPRDWRVILFPAWLIVAHSLLITLPAWWLLQYWDANVAGLFGAGMILGYLSYEVFHACEHLPPEHRLARLPWIRQMRQLHALHHRRELMQGRNFNIVLPLMDYLFGTLHWEPDDTHSLSSTMTCLQHQVDIPHPPQAVLAYASSVSQWPQWHPSSLRVEAPPGPLAAGAHFEEDIHAGGRAGHLSWEVHEYLPGHRWVAHAHGEGLHLRLTYECQPTASVGTRFIRTLEYRFSSRWMRLANRLLLKRRIERESAASMLALRDVAQRALAG